MAIELVFETHSITVDNELGKATGWLPGRLSDRGPALAKRLGDRRRRDRIAIRWGLDHYIRGSSLEDLMEQDFAWQEGWEYRLG